MTTPRTSMQVAGAPAAFRPAAPARPTRAWSPTWPKIRRWMIQRGWVHAVLLVGVVVCVYPLVWMFLTSVKTDDEVGREDLIPEIPVFRGHSPYVADAPEITRPMDVDPARFAAELPALRDLTTALATAALPAQVPPSVDAQAWAKSAGAYLLERALDQVPRQAWDQGTDAVLAQCRALLGPDEARAALSHQLSRLELTGLTLRTLDGRVFDLAPRHGAPPEWRVESGQASLAPDGAGMRLDYRFESGSDDAILVADDFDLPEGVEPADLHKIVVSLRADDSWHGVDATLDLGGTRWESTRRTYLGLNREKAISFQPPTFDDTTIRARTWVSLRAEGASDRARRGKLTLRLVPSSHLGAIAAKAERNYERAFLSGPFLRYVCNSLLLVALSVAGAIFSSAFVAYAFARLEWPGRGVALVLLLSTMMVPPQVTMVPSFLVWKSLGWYNTLNPIWVPAWFGNAFFIFLMIQHMKTIPRELEEAARIDGLNILQTWWYVIVPQLTPTLAAIAVMTFLGAWNEFMGPLIYLRDQTKFPLSLGLFGMRVDHAADWSMLMAGNVLMTIPTVAVFFRFQKYFIEGITVTGMKG